MTIFKKLTVSLFSCLLVFSPLVSHGESISKPTNKVIIGPVITVGINELNIELIGRVDTGAATTSINASNIKVADGHVDYTIINKDGNEYNFTSKIVKEKFVRNAEVREKRNYVYLTIEYQGVLKKTLVNLNDRSNSKYKILLGRNWLSGNYLVDVEKKRKN